MLFYSSAVEIKPISKLYGSNASLIDLSRCQEIKSGCSYKFEIEKERRLHSIPVRAATFDWNSFKNAALTIEGRKNDQSKWELLNVTRTNLVPDSNSSFVLTGYSKNYFKLFKISGLWIRICMNPHSFSFLDPDPGGKMLRKKRKKMQGNKQ